MTELELVFLSLLYLLLPLAVRLAAWHVEGYFRAGVVWGIAAAFAFVCGFLLGRFYLYHIFDIQEPMLWFYSTIAGIPLAFVEWKFAGWVESWIDVGEEIEQNLADQIDKKIGKLAQAVNQMGATSTRRMESWERGKTEILRSLEYLEQKFAASEERFSDLLDYEKNHQAVLEKIRESMFAMLNEVKELRKNTPPLETHDQTRSPSPSGKPAVTPRRLTTEEGRRARLSGREWQKWMGQLICDLAKKENKKINLENNPEKSKSDFVLRHPSTNRPVSVGPGKSYTLYPYQPGRHKSSQRTITSKMVYVELEFAKRHKLPFFILVVNQRTTEWWSHIITKEALDSFERVTTPSWLAEDQPPQEEVERNHREFTEFLKGLV